MQRVTVLASDGEDPQKKYTVAMKVQLNSGDILYRYVDAIRGDPETPLSDEDISKKFLSCGSGTILAINQIF